MPTTRKPGGTQGMRLYSPTYGQEARIIHCTGRATRAHRHLSLPQQQAARVLSCLSFPSDFPPVFHIKLKDQVLLEGEAATLLCLPAACPAPRISWMKGKHIVSSVERGGSYMQFLVKGHGRG